MIRRPPRSTRTDTLFPYTTLFRSDSGTSNTDINIPEDGWYSMSMYCYVGDSATNGRNYYVYLNGVITSQNTEIINTDRKSTRLNSSHQCASRMPSSA